MPRIRGQITGSGFISRSPRLLLRELDDNPGAYPTILRDGDSTRTGALATSFDDGSTIIFSENGSPVFPSMLPNGSSFNSQAVDVVGQESDISILAPIRSFQHPTYLHYSPTEAVGPFNENRVMPATDFFLSGTDPDTLPGFTSPTRSKIAIEIDITPQSDTRMMRNVNRRTVAEGGSSIGDQTGFLYYNFNRNEWEQIGLNDPATGGLIYYDYTIDKGNISGSFPMQFTTTPGFPGFSLQQRTERGYSKIGTPTAGLGAPSKTLYHATASQRLRMSNYISAPFLLEKVQVIFTEARAQRLQGDATTNSTFGQDVAARSGSNRDIDNYVFFAYHQRHLGSESDSLIGVSGSRRDLIFSGSISFWNSASFYGSSESEAILTHSPAFDHNFGLSYSTGLQIGQFTGSIGLEILPAVAGRQRSGLSLVPSSTMPGPFDQWLGTFWPGGTSFNNFEPDVLNVSSAGNFSDFFGWSANPSIDRFTPNLNARSIRSVGGEVALSFASGSLLGLNSNTEQSSVSPYILFPSDEIIFGFDAGVGPFQFSNSFLSITGSHFEIASKPCKVIFYGSLIKNNIELLPSLNQNLSSNSIHEIVGAEPVIDQFQIEPISSYYGSYLDDVVTGSMATPTNATRTLFDIMGEDDSRGIVSRVSLGQAGSTGSLQRFSNILDNKETVYDSCLPDYFEMLDLTFEESEYKFRGEVAIRYIGDPVDIYETGPGFASSIKQFPFEGNPKRRVQKTAALLNVNLMDIASDPVDFTGTTLDPLSVAFLTRYAFISKAPGFFLPDYTAPFYPFGYSNAGYDLSENLVSSYFFTGSANGILYDISENSHDLDFTPAAPDESPVTPVLNLLDDGSLIFPAAVAEGDVRFAAATPAIADHKMTSGAEDTPFTLSITFKADAIGTEQTLIERSTRSSLLDLAIEYRLFINASGILTFQIFKSGATLTNRKGVKVSLFALPSPYIVANTWYNVVVTYNGKRGNTTGLECMEIFLNGNDRLLVSDDAGTISNTIMRGADASRLWIAAGGKDNDIGPDEATEFVGLIHSAHIWKGRQLAATEIKGLSKAELTGVSNGIIKHRASFGIKSLITSLRAGAYRYGISNINQELSSVRISSFHFGHVRDTLEQRKDTAFVALKAPVSCKFISGSNLISANFTHAQNISTFATSSLPYFDDGIARNRSDNPDDNLTI